MQSRVCNSPLASALRFCAHFRRLRQVLEASQTASGNGVQVVLGAEELAEVYNRCAPSGCRQLCIVFPPTGASQFPNFHSVN